MRQTKFHVHIQGKKVVVFGKIEEAKAQSGL